jgi:hypothetical protein
MVKRLMEDYCEAKHPDDYDAQDALFQAICDGTLTPTMEEMIQTVNDYQDKKDGRPISPPAEPEQVHEHPD